MTKKKLKKRKEAENYTGRTYTDYLEYKIKNSNIVTTEMDTVYNNQSGPYIQTFIIFNHMYKRIKINHTQKLDSGETVQIITIYWNCIDAIEITDLPKIPDVDVTVNTRKDVIDKIIKMMYNLEKRK